MPPMPEGDYARLKASIEQAGGNRVPITIARDGRVLDGRHRLRACIELGIEPDTKEWDGAGSEVDLILDLNDRRRQLPAFQRVLIAAKLAHLGRGRPRENAPIRAITQEEAAEKLGVSRTLVQAARTVFDSGSPGLIDLVERGVLAISAARPIAGLRRAEQERLVREGPKALRARAAEIRPDSGRNRARTEGATDGKRGAGSPDGQPEAGVAGRGCGSAVATGQAMGVDAPTGSADGALALPMDDPVAEVSDLSTCRPAPSSRRPPSGEATISLVWTGPPGRATAIRRPTPGRGSNAGPRAASPIPNRRRTPGRGRYTAPRGCSTSGPA